MAKKKEKEGFSAEEYATFDEISGKNNENVDPKETEEIPVQTEIVTEEVAEPSNTSEEAVIPDIEGDETNNKPEGTEDVTNEVPGNDPEKTAIPEETEGDTKEEDDEVKVVISKKSSIFGKPSKKEKPPKKQKGFHLDEDIAKIIDKEAKKKGTRGAHSKIVNDLLRFALKAHGFNIKNKDELDQ